MNRSFSYSPSTYLIVTLWAVANIGLSIKIVHNVKVLTSVTAAIWQNTRSVPILRPRLTSIGMPIVKISFNSVQIERRSWNGIHNPTYIDITQFHFIGCYIGSSMQQSTSFYTIQPCRDGVVLGGGCSFDIFTPYVHTWGSFTCTGHSCGDKINKHHPSRTQQGIMHIVRAL